MQKALAISFLLTSLVGCSSAPKVVYQPEQAPYCNTEETTVMKNGQLHEHVARHECSDKPKVHHLNRDIGVAGMCRSYEKPVYKPNGSLMVIRGVMCRDKLTGAWVPADPNLSY